jgi:glutathione peroxidase
LKCGFTPQYEGLEALYRELSAEYPERFTILGFPCNQFGEQEPGSEDEIQQFCVLNFGVTFPLLRKVNVRGEEEEVEPLFNWIRKNNQGLLEDAEIQWNFEKTLISGTGEIVGRWRGEVRRLRNPSRRLFAARFSRRAASRWEQATWIIP